MKTLTITMRLDGRINWNGKLESQILALDDDELWLMNQQMPMGHPLFDGTCGGQIIAIMRSRKIID